MEFISFDSHKRYTVSIVEDKHGRIMDEARMHPARARQTARHLAEAAYWVLTKKQAR